MVIKKILVRQYPISVSEQNSCPQSYAAAYHGIAAVLSCSTKKDVGSAGIPTGTPRLQPNDQATWSLSQYFRAPPGDESSPLSWFSRTPSPGIPTPSETMPAASGLPLSCTPYPDPTLACPCHLEISSTRSHPEALSRISTAAQPRCQSMLQSFGSGALSRITSFNATFLGVTSKSYARH